MRIIRKVSIGPDYKDAMRYVHGQPVLDKTWQISNIIKTEDDVDIYIINDKGEEVLWKSLTKSLPMVVEYHIEI